jgi:hypothetical protein
VAVTLQWIGGGERIPSGWVWTPESEADAWLNAWRVCTCAWRCKAPWQWHAGWSQATAAAQRSPGGPHANSRGPQPSVGGSTPATSTAARWGNVYCYMIVRSSRIVWTLTECNYEQLQPPHWATHSIDRCNYSTLKVFSVFTSRCLARASNGSHLPSCESPNKQLNY